MIDSVICGDCLDVLADIPDKSVDLVVTDPPYDFAARGGGIYRSDLPMLSKIRDLKTNQFKPARYIPTILAKLKNINAYFFCNAPLIYDYAGICRDAKAAFDLLIVERSNPAPTANNHYPPGLDYVVFMKRGAVFNSGLKPTSLYRKIQRLGPTAVSDHPNEKSVEICRKYILLSSKEGDVVLDPFAGSGTTLVAARQLNRRYIGIEINEYYCEVARQRLSQQMLTL